MTFKELIDRFGHACYANNDDDLRIETGRALEKAVDALVSERDALREVCAEAYQFAGAYDAPEAVLDKLSAAANGDEIPKESYLPIESSWYIKRIDELEQELANLKFESDAPAEVQSDSLYPTDTSLGLKAMLIAAFILQASVFIAIGTYLRGLLP